MSTCEKATVGTGTSTGVANAETNASDAKANAQNEDLFDVAQALTSLGRKVSDREPSPTTTTDTSVVAQVRGSASNTFAEFSSSSQLPETVDGRLMNSAMSASSSSAITEGPKATEKDPFDDQTYGRFPDVLRLMMDYATAEGCKKPPYQRAASWSDDGKSIVILDKTLFCELILPLFFKRTKFPSFVRKLFRWGFSRVTSKAIRRSKNQIFAHPDFVRMAPGANVSSIAASSGATFAAGATTMPSAPLQQSGAVIPASVPPGQVNAVSPRLTPPAFDPSQVPPGAMALLSNGIQTNPQEEAVAQLLARRHQLEVEWEMLQEEAKIAKIQAALVGNGQRLPPAAPTGAAFLSSAGANPSCFPHPHPHAQAQAQAQAQAHAHAHALGVVGNTMLTSSSTQPSVEQAYYMAINGNGEAFRRVSLEPVPAPAPLTATPHAFPGQAFFDPQELSAAIAARAAAAAATIPGRPATATATMVAGGHLPAPTLPGRPESERDVINAAVYALHNSH